MEQMTTASRLAVIVLKVVLGEFLIVGLNLKALAV
jgi:hypothetical protein